MISLVHIIKYIINNNHIIKVPYYLISALLFQIFKRATNKTISKKLFNGRNLFLFPDSKISSLFAYTSVPDSKEIKLLRDIANKKTIFLDIGANIGSYSVLLMDVVKTVYAFEPHPRTAMRCKMNFLLNGYSDQNVLEMALSNVDAQLPLTDGPVSEINTLAPEAQHNGVLVKTRKLDDIANERLPLDAQYILKIDTEGHELKVFEGAQNFLQRYRVPLVVFESFEGKRDRVFTFLKSLGFSIIHIEGDNYYAKR